MTYILMIMQVTLLNSMEHMCAISLSLSLMCACTCACVCVRAHMGEEGKEGGERRALEKDRVQWEWKGR